MKLSYRNMIVSFIIIIFNSCNNNDIQEDQNLFGKYVIYEVSSESGIDINFDSQYNTDLFKEIDCLKNSAIYLYEGAQPGYSPEIDLLWPEACINDNDLLIGIPNKYSDGMKISYLPVSIKYYVKVDYDTSIIFSENKKNVDDSVYTLKFPDSFVIDLKHYEIVMTTTQRFLTINGVISVPFVAKFKYELIP